MQKINLAEKLSLIAKYWDPKIVGELNGQHVKLVKLGNVTSDRTVANPERI